MSSSSALARLLIVASLLFTAVLWAGCSPDRIEHAYVPPETSVSDGLSDAEAGPRTDVGLTDAGPSDGGLSDASADTRSDAVVDGRADAARDGGTDASADAPSDATPTDT